MSLFLPKFASWVGFFYLHFVGKTSFDQPYHDPQFLKLYRNNKNFIYCFWHNTQVYLSYAHRGEYACVLVSRSRDGEFIAQVMNRLGLKPVRGSSTRGGGKGLIEMIEQSHQGRRLGFTPDGPKGPPHIVHPGVILAAQETGLTVVPVTAIPRRRIEFNSWDKFMLPLPFGFNALATGRPFYIKTDEDMGLAKLKIQQALNHVTEEAHKVDICSPSWGHAFLGEVLFCFYRFFSVILIPLLIPLLIFKYGLRRSLLSIKERVGIGAQASASEWKIWFHVASVGEWSAVKSLLNNFKNKSGCSIFITTATPEAKTIISKEEPDLFVSLIPIDNVTIMKNWLRKQNPDAVVIVETEIWPGLIEALRQAAIPVFVVNGRLSKKSVRSWSLVKPFISRTLRNISWFCIRSNQDAKHFARLGGPVMRVSVTGNMKNDNFLIQPSESRKDIRLNLFRDSEGVLVVGGSTWPGEEKLLLKLLDEKTEQKIKIVLAPRRMERIAEVSKLLETKALSWSRYSRVKKEGHWDTDVLLVDTLGDLKNIYAAADVAFVGGSLYPRGGQNPLEPAAVYVPLVCGPHMENFEEELMALKQVGAIRQGRFEKDIVSDLRELIQEKELRTSLGEMGAQVVKQNQGASQRNFELLCQKMGI